jgi:signal transduction histidine kinase
VHGNIETVLNHREKLSSENVDKKLETIYGQIKHLSEMVQDLSDIAIIESGQMPLNKEAFFMEELIESVISEYEGLAKAKNMKLVGEHEPQQTPVYADPLRIRQVLLNLVSNAIKYSSNDSNIILKVAYKDNQAFTSVKDFGIGIPEDEQKRIFKSYYRLDTHVRKGQKGTGLGLNICKYLIKMHDSVLSLESSPNEGTEFSFFLQCFDESLLKELPTK